MQNLEMDIAAKVHYSFLPAGYENDFLDVAVQARPHNRIGGDYCSILPLDEKNLIVCMCDAVGHGIASALYAARVNSFVLTHFLRHGDPCNLIYALNEFLCRHLSDTGIYTTFCSIFINYETREMEIAGAAHPPVLYYNKEVGDSEMLSSETTLLGLHHPLPLACSSNRRTLHSGDKVVLYTDGLIETGWEKRMSSGIEHLKEFTRSNYHLSSTKFNDVLLAETIKRSDGQLNDDILVLTVTIK